MGEIRYNYLHDSYVIFAPKRRNRPYIFVKSSEKIEEYYSPFVYGNEDKIPKEVFSIRDYGEADKPGWRVRVVPNLFGVLEKSNFTKTFFECNEYGFQNYGYHEVVIETPDPFKQFEDFSVDEAVLVLKAFQNRIKSIYKDRKIKYIHIFKNAKDGAGASLLHSHSQILATPFLTKRVEIELNQLKKFYKKKKKCYLCDEIGCEISLNERVIYKNKKFIIYAPYSSILPYQIRVAPINHMYSFLELKNRDLEDFAKTLTLGLKTLVKCLNNPAYNFVLKISPNIKRKDLEKYFHWYIDIFPRVSKFGGYEIESGNYINIAMPENVAKELKGLI